MRFMRSKNYSVCAKKGRINKTRLNPNEVREIRKSKMSPKELANKFKISISSVYSILERKAWRWV